MQVYNAGSAWARDPGGVHDAPPAMRDDFAASVRRDMIPMLVDAAEGRLTARLLPDEGQRGQALKVLEIRGAQLAPVKLYINSKALVVRQQFETPGPDGQPVEADESFSDYRAVDGVQVPFRADVRRAESSSCRARCPPSPSIILSTTNCSSGRNSAPCES